MSAHDEAVELSARAMPHEAWDNLHPGQIARYRSDADAAITAYLSHMRAAGYVVARMPEVAGTTDADPRMSEGYAITWSDGWNACRAAMIEGENP